MHIFELNILFLKGENLKHDTDSLKNYSFKQTPVLFIATLRAEQDAAGGNSYKENVAVKYKSKLFFLCSVFVLLHI